MSHPRDRRIDEWIETCPPDEDESAETVLMTGVDRQRVLSDLDLTPDAVAPRDDHHEAVLLPDDSIGGAIKATPVSVSPHEGQPAVRWTPVLGLVALVLLAVAAALVPLALL